MQYVLEGTLRAPIRRRRRGCLVAAAACLEDDHIAGRPAPLPRRAADPTGSAGNEHHPVQRIPPEED
jgi:hypothetical protein